MKEKKQCLKDKGGASKKKDRTETKSESASASSMIGRKRERGSIWRETESELKINFSSSMPAEPTHLN